VITMITRRRSNLAKASSNSFSLEIPIYKKMRLRSARVSAPSRISIRSAIFQQRNRMADRLTHQATLVGVLLFWGKALGNMIRHTGGPYNQMVRCGLCLINSALLSYSYGKPKSGD